MNDVARIGPAELPKVEAPERAPIVPPAIPEEVRLVNIAARESLAAIQRNPNASLVQITLDLDSMTVMVQPIIHAGLDPVNTSG